MTSTSPASDASWLVRHEFLIRRLHSLSGLIPVGAYMIVHLLTNASVLDSAGAFQENVYRIHSLGKALVVVEWAFIFLPLIFHAVFGVVIIRGGLSNTGNYPYARNWRYTLQRVSGMIAMLFIFWHVFHLHGWFHFEGWLHRVAEPLNGANFRPYNAASSLTLALRGYVQPTLYAIGILACVYHLANGIWTMGITWGVWVSPAAQQRASKACLVFGLGLAFVGLSALYGAKTIDLEDAIETEDSMFDARITARELPVEKTADGTIEPAERIEHKRFDEQEREEVEAAIQAQDEPDSADDEATAQAPSTDPAAKNF